MPRKEAVETSEFELIRDGKHAPVTEGNTTVVVVKAATADAALSLDAKTFTYAQRFSLNLDNVGIERAGGLLPQKDGSVLVRFKFTRGL